MKCSAVFLLGSILIAHEIINSQAAPTEAATAVADDSEVHNRQKRELCLNVGKYYMKMWDIDQYKHINSYYRAGSTNSARRRKSGILGCKFPFHYGVFVCCRSNRGDCSEHHREQMKKSALTFKKCMEAGTYGQRRDNHIKCWVDAEKTHACSHSYYDARYYQQLINDGVAW